ncbi:MAG: hypothetical protein KDB53_19105, partial [Planctomycetes bacterium]|nr:hypothetical protein [Planctomycetota bacterium]
TEALEHLRRALDADPSHALSYQLRGRILATEGHLEAAKGELERARRLDPMEAAESHRTLARIAEAQGRQIDQIEHLGAAFEADPSDLLVVDQLVALARQGIDDPAALLASDLVTRLVDRRPPNVELDARLALVLETRGDPYGALELARRAVTGGATDQRAVQVLRRLAGRGIEEAFLTWCRALEINDVRRPALRDLEALLAEENSETPVAGPARAVGSSSSKHALQLLSAFQSAGWHEEALQWVAAHGEGSLGVEVREKVEAIRRHRRLVAKLQLLARELEMGLRPTVSADLDELLATIAALIESECGIPAAAGNLVLRLPFVGEILDNGEFPAGSINDYFQSRGQVLFAGKVTGESARFFLMNVVDGPRRRDPWSGRVSEEGYFEYLGENVLVRPGDDAFGETAGRALYRSYYLDLDILIPWKRRLLAEIDLPDQTRQRLLSTRGLEANGFEQRTRIDRPLEAATSLLLRAWTLHGDLPLVETVRAHELGHLVDARHYLPIENRFLSNLWLALQGGFVAGGIMSYLEEAAELHALRHGPSPHLVLAELVRSIPRQEESGPHAAGYRRLLGRFLVALDARLGETRGLRADRTLLHQLHLLDEATIRDIAESL